MKKTLLFSFFIALGFVALAVTAPGDPVPVDPAYRIGKLDNGLTYYIRHNTEPPGRASYYIIQNVGAILESDSQNGLAHFLEHMAFNGTTRFPGKDIISKLERHGVAFGRNINAYTSWDETVYNISDVPVDKPGLTDTCLMILADWSDYLTLSEEEINNERGVIIEEWRSRRNASWRMMNKMFPVIFEGSKYAVRDIIGDTAVLRSFHPDTLRAFYHEWYRTDLQAIAIVGDIDVDAIEASIRKIFSTIPAVENPAPRTDNLLVPKAGTRYLLVTDPEATETAVSLMIVDSLPDNKPRDTWYIRDGFVISLMNSMMRTRFSEILQKGTPPFVSGDLSYSSFIPRNYNALTLSASARENEEARAFEAALTELERARRHGFTQGELERAKSSMRANFESMYKQRDKISNDSWARQVRDHFLTGEPVPPLDVEYEYYKQILPQISKEEVSARLRSLVVENNSFIIVEGPEGHKLLSEPEALALVRKVREAEIAPYEDIAGGLDLINEPLAGAEIIKTLQLDQFRATEWTLSNGARVVFKHAEFEKDNVTVTGFAFGGASVYADSLVPSLSLFGQIISMYGAGEFDNPTLTKMLAGKKASVSLGIQEVMQTVSGNSTPKDFETLMQLLYLRFARPNLNREAFDAITGRFSAMITAMQKDPNKMMSDSLNLNMTGYHPRTFIMTPESMKKIRFEDVNHIYETAFDDASAFTFFITGNIEELVARDMAARYIGSLPSKQLTETWKDLGVRQPEGVVKKEIQIPLAVPKATVVINYSAESKYVPENYLAMDVLKGILDLVYTEKVREAEGGTYGVSVNASSQLRPVAKSVLMVAFECDPQRADELKAIIYRELEGIAKNGPTKENLDKTVSNLLKTREEALQHNNYWANTIRSYYLTGIDTNAVANYNEILNGMTVKTIQKLTRKYLAKADLLELVFVPENK
ncbi:MAG: insulinase family protein [Bacteroidales bacterium]|nr:insulinase family protein [Bacteroidales bacterium]